MVACHDHDEPAQGQWDRATCRYDGVFSQVRVSFGATPFAPTLCILQCVAYFDCMRCVHFRSAGSFISQGIANVPVAVLLVSFSVVTTKYGSAFAHSLPSHVLSRVMGVVVAGMAPVVVQFGGKKLDQQVTEDAAHAAAASSSSSSAGANLLDPLPSFLPKGIEIPSVGYAPRSIIASWGFALKAAFMVATEQVLVDLT